MFLSRADRVKCFLARPFCELSLERTSMLSPSAALAMRLPCQALLPHPITSIFHSCRYMNVPIPPRREEFSTTSHDNHTDVTSCIPNPKTLRLPFTHDAETLPVSNPCPCQTRPCHPDPPYQRISYPCLNHSSPNALPFPLFLHILHIISKHLFVPHPRFPERHTTS